MQTQTRPPGACRMAGRSAPGWPEIVTKVQGIGQELSAESGTC